MAKVKYYYDELTLSYRKIKVKKGDHYRRILFSFLAVMLIAFLGFFTFFFILTFLYVLTLSKCRAYINIKATFIQRRK